MSLRVSVSPIDLPLLHPFKIARGEETLTRTALVRLHAGDHEGLGEATPIERYDETYETVVEYFATHSLASNDPYRLEALLHDGIPAAARGGLDLALYDWIGKDLGKPLYALLGLDPALTPVTSFTIGIADPETTMKKVAEVGDHPILKVKLGAGTAAEQIETIALIRERYTGAIRIDANEGWDAADAIRILSELARFDIEFCEQPIPAGHPQQLRAVRDRVNIPIVTDEDSLDRRRSSALVRMRRRHQREAREDRRHPRRACDDSHGARDGFQSHARVHGRERDCSDRRGASVAAGRLGRHRRTVLNRKRPVRGRHLR